MKSLFNRICSLHPTLAEYDIYKIASRVNYDIERNNKGEWNIEDIINHHVINYHLDCLNKS